MHQRAINHYQVKFHSTYAHFKQRTRKQGNLETPAAVQPLYKTYKKCINEINTETKLLPVILWSQKNPTEQKRIGSTMTKLECHPCTYLIS